MFQPFFHIYFRLSRIGREHIPAEGPVIVAANHRSFLDPFVIATMVRRPMYYVAKKELFSRPWQAWVLNALGAFPVDRGSADGEMIETAKAILGRGDIVLIFPEGTRIRPGALGHPKRGVGRLALESGVPVVPVAVIGTEDVRKGWRIRPRKVRIRAGRALRFPEVHDASPALAGAVTDRIWPCVMLQWEWLGGLPPIRRAAIVGAGSWGTSLAVSLARAGFEVDLGCRTQEQALTVAAARENEHLSTRSDAARVDQGDARLEAQARRPRPRMPCRSRALATERAGGPRREHPAAGRRTRPLQGARAAARDAALGVRLGALPRACGRRFGRPVARRGRARARRVGGARIG